MIRQLWILFWYQPVSHESKDRMIKLEASIYVVGGEEWKLVAEELGLSPREIRYIDKRVMNPCEAVLAYISRQCSISVGELYDRLNKCGLPVTADLL